MAEPIQKKRLLRMTVAIHRQPDVSEEAFYQWVTEQHAAQAARLHARNGLEGFAVYFTPKSFRDVADGLNEARGGKWKIRTHDAQVEFLFRDMATFYQGAADPDFQALQAEEAPYVSADGAEFSLGWVEVFVHEGKVVHLDEGGKSVFPPFAAMSQAP